MAAAIVTEQIKAQIIFLYEDGSTIAKIAQSLGLGKTTVCRHLRLAKIPVRNKEKYDRQERARWIEALKQGLRPAQISKNFSVPKTVILREINRVFPKDDLSQRKKASLIDAETVKLWVMEYEDGASLRQLSIKYGFAGETIKKYINKHGIDFNDIQTYHYSEKDSLLWAQLHKEGVSIKDIGIKCGVGVKTIRNHIRKLGINRKDLICETVSSDRKNQRYKDKKNEYRASHKEEAKIHKERIKEIRLSFKKDLPCARCGKTYHPCAMEFDHILQHDKKFQISLASNLQKIETEVAKCQVLCVLCHRQRSHEQRAARSAEIQKTWSPQKIKQNQKTLEKRKLFNVLKSRPCEFCNIQYEYYQMDFDHIDPATKKIGIAQIALGPHHALTEELDKCRLLCALCHRLHTHGQLRTYLP